MGADSFMRSQPAIANYQPHSASLRGPWSLIALLILIILGLTLAAPLLQGETLCTDDGALHVYRTVALDRAMAGGVLYPRWFPDLAYGYGFPFFVYREPLGYYALEGLHRLGVSVPNAFNLVLAGSLVLSGVTMFLLAGDIFGPRGGLLAGVAYLTAPYTLIGPLTRGNLPEVIAFALMPLILFFFRRLVVLRGARYFAAAIVAYAALFLTHNISTLLFTPLLLAYIAILGWAQMADSRSQIVDRPAAIRDMRYAICEMQYACLAIVLTLGLTAFFWLPALVEQDQAQLYLTHSSRGNDYHFNFIGLDELLGGPGSSDPHLLNPPLRIVFGWPQLALAALGVIAYRRTQSGEQRATIAAAAAATVALVFMALPASLPFWDNLPLIRFVQFPWRFVGRAMLPAALLAGAIFSSRDKTNHQDTKAGMGMPTYVFGNLRVFVPSWLFSISIFTALLFTTPLAYPHLCPTPHDLDINDVFAYERATGHIGVDPLGAYLPRTVIERPTGSPLEAQYTAEKTGGKAASAIERFDTRTLPAGARLLDAQYGPNRADLTLSTPRAFTATYLAFAFPGWRVSIDDQPVETRPSDPAGLITFDVPAGEHRIHIAFGSSPQRAFADGLSLIALLAALVVVILVHRGSGRQWPITHRLSPATGNTQYATIVPVAKRSGIRNTLYALLALLTFILVKVAFVDTGRTPLRASRLAGETLAGVSRPLEVTFGERLRLLGYDVSASSTRPGETIRVDLYWKALRPLDAAYQAEVRIADADGWAWSPKHAERPRDYNTFPPTLQWAIDAYALDSFEVETLPGTPPGNYTLVAQIFDRATLAPLPPSPASGPGQLTASIGSIRIDRAARTFDAGQLRIYGGERIELDADLTLLGYNIDRVDTAPGESVLLTFFWQARHAPQADRVLRVELAGASDDALASRDIVIGGDAYPTSRWSAEEQIVAPVVMRVPAATPSGEYHWRGSLLDDAGRPGETFDMRPAFRVAAPEPMFDIPRLLNRIDVDVGDFATLLGFDLAADRLWPGGAIDLTLYWQARAETTTAYKVFVHVLDAAGRLVAQADAFPARNTRPTTGWLPGEVIADRYTVALPEDLSIGQYQIVAGLYDPDSGLRLKTGEGNEFVALADAQLTGPPD